MHLALPQAPFSIQIKFLLHIFSSAFFTCSCHLCPAYSFSCLFFFLRFPLSPYFHQSLTFSLNSPSCQNWHLFTFHQSPADSSSADLSKLFFLTCKHPLRTTDREGRGGMWDHIRCSCTADTFQVSSTKTSLVKKTLTSISQQVQTLLLPPQKFSVLLVLAEGMLMCAANERRR